MSHLFSVYLWHLVVFHPKSQDSSFSRHLDVCLPPPCPASLGRHLSTTDSTSQGRWELSTAYGRRLSPGDLINSGGFFNCRLEGVTLLNPGSFTPVKGNFKIQSNYLYFENIWKIKIHNPIIIQLLTFCMFPSSLSCI